MKEQEIFNKPETKWTQGCGPHADIVISSRVRLARNIKDVPFPHSLSESREKEILDSLRTITESPAFTQRLGNFRFIPLEELSTLERWVLVEKHLISPQQGQGHGHQGVALREDETVSIMINEEDHLRIQCLFAGMRLHEAWQLANQVDDSLEATLDFAFDREKGYLTSCPTNVGTGMRASVMMHLPGLMLTRRANQVFSTMSQIGLTVRGMYGEGTEATGNLFQISNQVTLGLSEIDIINHLSSVTIQVIEQEQHAREILLRESKEKLEDRVWRAYGILSQARILSSQEAMRLLSELRLGIDLKMIKDIPANIFNELIVQTQPAFMQSHSTQELSPALRDIRRAELIREKLAGKIGGESA